MDNEPIRITGLASTTQVDRVGDVIVMEAWAKGLENYVNNPIILFNHDYDEPVGKMVDFAITSAGLQITAEIYPEAENVYNMVKRGVLSTFSVGFQIKDASYDPMKDIFYIKELDLYEISVVSVPANAGATFSVSKSLTADELDAIKKEFSATAEVIKPAVEAEIEKEIEKMSDTIDVQAIAAAAAEAAVAKSVQMGASGAERLAADLEARLADTTKSLSDQLDGVRAELAEKAAELEAFQKSKRVFTGEGNVDYSEKEKAVFLAVAARKGMADTKYGRAVLEKAGPHVSSGDFEKEVSRSLEDAIRNRLVLGNLFRTINMNTPSMVIPVNPEASLGTWVDPANYGSANASGTAATHALTEITLTARKLAAKEYLTIDEEEDAILALVPFIRDAITRRISRSWETALLRGTGANAADPITGLVTLDATSAVTLPVANKVTAATLVAARRDLGIMGLDPVDVVYVVSQDAYYDLLEDSNFITMDKVGDRATLLNGMIGSVSGSPVLVSSEFEAKAATKACALAIYKPNFIVGSQRGLRMESEYSVESQATVLVGSLKVAFKSVETSATKLGVSAVRWTA